MRIYCLTLSMFFAFLQLSCFKWAISSTQVLNTTEAFVTRIRLDRNAEDKPEDMEVFGSLSGAADLPSWMNFYHRELSHLAYFYGTPSVFDDGDVEIDLVYINTFNFNFFRDRIKYRILAREEIMHYELELKLFEYDLQDVFEQNISAVLRDIFVQKIWKNSKDIYVTQVATPLDLGGRYPLDPREKEGVIIRLGSVDNFSEEVLRIESEVKQIQNRVSCPKGYKTTSFEYLFREKNLFIDWCSFQLYKHHTMEKP